MAAKDGTRKITRVNKDTGRTYEYWSARLFEDGKQKDFTSPTQREAIAKRKDYLKRKEMGLAVDRTTATMTLGAFLAAWLEVHIKPHKAPKTAHDYERIVKHDILPHPIAKIALTKLAPGDAQKWVNETAARLKPNGRLVGADTVRLAHAVLRSALSRAKRDRLIGFNPAEDIDRPKVRRKKVEALSEEAEQAILAAFKDHPLEPIVTVTIALGLRQSEVLGLRWRDLDLDGATPSLTIAGKFRRDMGRWVFDEFAKSDSSLRTLRLPAPVVELLKRHRASSPYAFDKDRPVFTTSTGTPIDGTNLTHRFQTVLAEAGLPRMKFHDLRHGAASLLLSDGESLFAVKEVLGHSQISLTSDLYGHLTDKGKQAVADRITARWQRAATS